MKKIIISLSLFGLMMFGSTYASWGCQYVGSRCNCTMITPNGGVFGYIVPMVGRESCGFITTPSSNRLSNNIKTNIVTALNGINITNVAEKDITDISTDTNNFITWLVDIQTKYNAGMRLTRTIPPQYTTLLNISKVDATKASVDAFNTTSKIKAALIAGRLARVQFTITNPADLESLVNPVLVAAVKTKQAALTKAATTVTIQTKGSTMAAGTINCSNSTSIAVACSINEICVSGKCTPKPGYTDISTERLAVSTTTSEASITAAVSAMQTLLTALNSNGSYDILNTLITQLQKVLADAQTQYNAAGNNGGMAYSLPLYGTDKTNTYCIYGSPYANPPTDVWAPMGAGGCDPWLHNNNK